MTYHSRQPFQKVPSAAEVERLLHHLPTVAQLAEEAWVKCFEAVTPPGMDAFSQAAARHAWVGKLPFRPTKRWCRHDPGDRGLSNGT